MSSTTRDRRSPECALVPMSSLPKSRKHGLTSNASLEAIPRSRLIQLNWRMLSKSLLRTGQFVPARREVLEERLQQATSASVVLCGHSLLPQTWNTAPRTLATQFSRRESAAGRLNCSPWSTTGRPRPPALSQTTVRNGRRRCRLDTFDKRRWTELRTF